MKGFLKGIASLLMGEYAAYYIYKQEIGQHATMALRPSVTIKPIEKSIFTTKIHPLIMEQRAYFGDDSLAYACYEDDRIIATCFYWHGSRYVRRNFWPLRENEVKLVQIITLPEARGKGVAPVLIRDSFEDVAKKGFDTAYARVWHSNIPSHRAFEKAGWKKIALVLEVNPFRRPRPMRIRLNLSI